MSDNTKKELLLLFHCFWLPLYDGRSFDIKSLTFYDYMAFVQFENFLFSLIGCHNSRNSIYPEVWFHDWFPGVMWYKSITSDIFLESPWALLQKSAQKWQICKNPIIYCAIYFLSKKCANKNCANCNKLYIFKLPFTQRIPICKNLCKIFKPECVFKKNWKCANSSV